MTARAPELTAAASRFVARRLRVRQVDQGWQDQAWSYFDSTPEVRFAATWVGNAMSGAKLFAGRRNSEGSIDRAPDDHRAAQLVASIAGGPDGQAQLLGGFGPHLVVAGEGWIMIRPDRNPAGDDTGAGADWRVLSVSEVTQQGNNLVADVDGEPVVIPPYDADQPDPDAPVAIRVWEPHPRKHMEADSPVRSSLGLLEELRLLNAAVAAIARSRLTGRGILLVPKGTTFPRTKAEGDAEDDLIELLMTVAETAYKDPESAAATVPIILEVPADKIGEMRWLTFESDFDELAIRLREEAIRRFATGLEMPAEILLGLGDTNHWSVWQLSQEAIRLAIEPKLGTVAHALTTQWLRPLLEDEGVADAGEWLVWYDSSPLRVRQNRSEIALQVYDRNAISDEALRRETGFEEDDAPRPGAPNTQGDRADDGQERGRPADPDLPVDETMKEPDTLPASTSASAGVAGEGLLAAADGLIWAALSAAGEKLIRTPACPRSERGRAKAMQPAALHTLLSVDGAHVEQWRLLDGAWSRVPEIAARYGVDGDCLAASLDSYCRELIAAGVDHTWEQTAGVLRAPCLVAA
ncbi:hypothetical protein F5972_08210 [Microbispora cellulosiformans]|uniref:Phage portal protein n=1 Tax=Microbispora cellulosiformans TaxID=2614688 RepID=A0A5J5K762_9ACTN|nr:hypothetical protein [Microbispora cellulosiformans]KAA9379628.1 hypothetical protein F5972_08210 [Microbispora cellulosiformans]